MSKDVKKQVEGEPVSNGCAKPKLRKASVTPSPSDKGSSQNGKG